MIPLPRPLALAGAAALLWATAPAWAQTLPTLGEEPTGEAAKAPAVEPATPIPLNSPDAQIRDRLARLFGAVDRFEGVRARVSDGIVTLEGTTLSGKARREAASIAGRLAGVVSVENKITAEHRVARRLDPLIARSSQMAGTVIAFLPLMLVALLVFGGFWLFGRYLTGSTRLFKRLVPNEFIETLVEQVVRLLFILAGLVAAMSILGATAMLGSVLGAAGVIGLAVGFAVRDTIENYIASILLSIRQPFRPNDSVVIEGFEGRITRLNSRATIITTDDGNEVRIPNATVYKANIINHTHTPERRFEFEIGIGLACEICSALAIALKAVRAVPGVLDSPEPGVIVDRIDAYAVVIKVQGWADQGKSDFDKVRGEAIRTVKEAFDAAGIEIPAPVRTVRTIPAAGKPQPAPSKRTAPSPADLGEVRDTRADRTTEKKVQAIRGQGAEDLLVHDAPRE